MFKILSLLRDLNTLRHIDWKIEEDDGMIVVKIPVDQDDIQFVKDMQRMFEPV